MLNRHLLAYLPVHIAQALVGFGGVIVFTRLLGPEQYGRYALVLAAAALISTIWFTWLDAAVARHHARAAARGRLAGHLATAWRVYAALAAGIAAISAIFIAAAPVSADMKSAMAFAAAAIVARSGLSIALETRRAAGEAGRYALLESFTLSAGFAFGVVFIVAGGLGAAGPFAGLALAAAIALVIDAPVLLSRSKRDRADGRRAASFLAYGAPVAFSLIFEHLLSSGDRFVIAGFLGEAATGAYAAGYGVADRSIDIVFIWLGAAAGPLAVAAFEQRGRDAARDVVRQAGAMMGLLGFPAAAGLALVSEPLAEVLIASELADRAGAIMPLIALGALFNGVMTYFFHEAFILGRKPKRMAAIMIAAAAFNIALNLILVPALGLTGAALATVIAYAAALAACAMLARSVFPLALPVSDWARAGFATAVMSCILVAAPSPETALAALVTKIALGGASYAGLAWLLNIAGCRAWLRAPFKLQEARS